MDLEKFFDRVNHDLLMEKLSKKIDDGRALCLIRRYLEAGMMAQGIVSPRTEGTPPGSPLSPLLSNILLTEPDRELERRGHAFCRYADDCNIYVYVRSQTAGERGHGKHHPVSVGHAQAHGQCGQDWSLPVRVGRPTI